MAAPQGKQVEADDPPSITQVHVQEEPQGPGNVAPIAGPVVQRRREDENRGGYECAFVLPPPHTQTECAICLLVLRSPHLASCCGHNFCKECIERVQKAGKCCPLCNKDNFTLTYNRAHDMSLQQFEVYCTQRKMGCEWRGKLEMLDTHLNVNPKLDKQLEGCAFVEVQCYHDGCTESLERRLIAHHQTEDCAMRPYSCDYCHDYSSTKDDVLFNHWPVCRCYPVSCPNYCTDYAIERQNLEQHLKEECPLQEVECEFKYAGCEAKLPRKDMPDHLKDSVGHMTLLARQNQMLALQNQALAHQNQELMTKMMEKDEELKRTMEDNRREMEDNQREMEDSIARLTECQQQDTEMQAHQNEELRARLVEKDEQIRELAKQHRKEMDRLEEEKSNEIKELSAEARQTAKQITEGLDAIKATLDDRLTAIQQKSDADYAKVVHHVGEAESRRANVMSQMEGRVTKLENSKAVAAKVKQLKDHVEEIERSTTTKAEHEKLVQQSVTRRELTGLVQKQEATNSSLKKLQDSTAPAAEVATLKNQVRDMAQKQDTVVTTVEKLHHHVLISPVQFVMSKYGRHKQDDDHCISDRFYTHPQGYKVYLNMCANGHGDGKGTHVACFISLMRGEFDNHLKWPFRGDVTITLLNQREDKNHLTKTVPFNDQTPDEYTARVTSGERSGRGRGYSQFILHSELGYNPATNCQYLVNDCLYFRVKVELR